MDTKHLLRQYVDSGISIPEYQFNRLSNNLKKTYIRKREISVANGGHYPREFELKHFSYDALLKTVITFSSIIEDIDNPSEELQLAAIQIHGTNIVYIKNPTEKVKLTAVKRDGNSIKYIENPNEELQVIAIQQDPELIQYIENPTENVQTYIINNTPHLSEKIKNPSEKIVQYIDRFKDINENVNRIKKLIQLTKNL